MGSASRFRAACRCRADIRAKPSFPSLRLFRFQRPDSGMMKVSLPASLSRFECPPGSTFRSQIGTRSGKGKQPRKSSRRGRHVCRICRESQLLNDLRRSSYRIFPADRWVERGSFLSVRVPGFRLVGGCSGAAIGPRREPRKRMRPRGVAPIISSGWPPTLSALERGRPFISTEE